MHYKLLYNGTVSVVTDAINIEACGTQNTYIMIIILLVLIIALCYNITYFYYYIYCIILWLYIMFSI